MVEILGNIAGNKVILNGCTLNSAKTFRTSGYVFVKTEDYPDGEVLFFEGGSVSNGMHLVKTNVSVTANAEPYPAAYVERTLVPGLGSESFSWSDFVELSDKTNRALMEEVNNLKTQIAGLSPAPVGSIQMWPSDTLPKDYHLCDGSTLNISDYPSLYAVLGTTYGGSGSTFKLPNMQGLFVAGKGTNNYSSLGATGGANTVELDMNNIPKHNHNTSTSTTDGDVTITSGSHNHAIAGGYGSGSTYRVPKGDITKSGSASTTEIFYTNNDGSHSHNIPLKARGGNQNGATVAHENRPPFIVLNYIIKVQ